MLRSSAAISAVHQAGREPVPAVPPILTQARSSLREGKLPQGNQCLASYSGSTVALVILSQARDLCIFSAIAPASACSHKLLTWDGFPDLERQLKYFQQTCHFHRECSPREHSEESTFVRSGIATRCMAESTEKYLLGLELRDLVSLMDEFNEPSYRAQQLFEALYRQRIGSLEEMSTLPASLRGGLTERGYGVGAPHSASKFRSVDGTVRYLIACTDGQTVETVWMPEGDGGEAGDGTDAGEETSRRCDRATICVSSQIGCAVDCQFCLTALLGVKRNLTAGEIVGQV